MKLFEFFATESETLDCSAAVARTRIAFQCAVAALALILTPPLSADSIWHDSDDVALRDSVGYPHRLLSLDADGLRYQLSSASREFDGSDGVLISLPMPDGQNALFSAWDSPILSAELAARYPMVKTYRVVGVDDPTASGRIGLSDLGFHGSLSTDAGQVLIDAAGNGHYRSYHKRDFAAGQRGLSRQFSCGVSHSTGQRSSPVAEFSRSLRTEGPRRNYRIAVAATGEYTAQVGGGNANTALTDPNGIIAAINRVNEIYNRDLNIQLTLVTGTELVYTDASSDPYTNNDGFAMLQQNQNAVDGVFGDANYDIGHVFSTGGGGVANLGVVCLTGGKARGVTGLPNPVGDPFFIDFVSHEIGHQFSALHSFNGTTLNCNQRSVGSAFEPGSGTTIMAYAGICDTENIQNNSDATFHAGSIDQIIEFAGTVSCETEIASSNQAPNVMAGNDYTIPGGTPFKLTGSATDPETDPLLFQWDQMDGSGVDETTAQTIGTDLGSNPLFRSFEPTSTSNERYFPNLDNLMNNTSTIGETIPTAGRNINLRLTARDGQGGVDSDDTRITVANSAGPFVVTQPNSALMLDTDQPQVIEWDPACSNLTPVNCDNVDIEISIDGGSTFTTLEAGTPNDGSQSLMITPTVALSARIKVACSDNVFFDLADEDVQLLSGSGTVLLASDNAINSNCGTVGGTSSGTGPGSSASSTSSSGGSTSMGWLGLWLLGLLGLRQSLRSSQFQRT